MASKKLGTFATEWEGLTYVVFLRNEINGAFGRLTDPSHMIGIMVKTKSND